MTKQEMITLKANILGGMHEYVKHINDERAYDLWIELAVPDEPREEDFIDIAEDMGLWIDCVKTFNTCVSVFAKTSADEVVN